MAKMQPHAKRSLRVTPPKCDTHSLHVYIRVCVCTICEHVPQCVCELAYVYVCMCVCLCVYGGVNYAQLKWLLGSAFKFVTRFKWVANKRRA